MTRFETAEARETLRPLKNTLETCPPGNNSGSSGDYACRESDQDYGGL